MLMRTIRIEHKEAISKIYEKVKETPTHLSQLSQFECLLKQALQIAAEYGKDHALYTALEQTMKDQLIPARSIPQKSKDCYFALNDLKLYFLGDLIGWF